MVSPADMITVDSAIEFSTVDPAAVTGWDACVHDEAGRDVFHTTAWAKVLTETYGHQPLYLVARENGRLVGWLPLMEVSSLFTGCRGVSLPFVDECAAPLEPAGSAELQQLARKLLGQAVELGKARGWKTIEFRGGFLCGRGLPEDKRLDLAASPRANFSGATGDKSSLGGRDGHGDSDLGAKIRPSISYYGHRLDLDEDDRRMFERLDGSTRRAIRKAMSASLRMEISSTPEAITVYYGLHCRTRRKHGLPPQPASFFQNIQRYLLDQGQGTVVTAWLGKKAIASAVFLRSRTQAIFKYGASDEAYQALRGNNLVMWTGICWLARNGFESLHLGRTSLHNEGLRRFKQGYATEEYKISYYKYHPRRNVWLQERDRVYGWYNPLFRLLPIGLLRRIGKVVYPHLD